MLAIVIFWGLTLFTVSACLFAVIVGGRAERLAAGVIIANIAFGYAARAYFPGAIDSLRMANDGLAALALLVLAVRYAAPWLGGAMLFYAAQFSLHSYFLVMSLPSVTSLHANLNNFNFAGITCCLIAGTTVTWRRRVRGARARHAAGQSPAA